MDNNNQQDHEGQAAQRNSPRRNNIPARELSATGRNTGPNVEYRPMHAANRNASNNTPRAATGRMPNANNNYPPGLGAMQEQGENDFAAIVNNNYNYYEAYRYGEVVYNPMGRCPYVQCPWNYIYPAYAYFPTPLQAAGFFATAPHPCYCSACLQLPPYRPMLNFSPAPSANMSSQPAARHLDGGSSNRNSGRARPAPASQRRARTYSEVVAGTGINHAEHAQPLPATGSPRMRPAQNMTGNASSSENRNCRFDFELVDSVANVTPGNSLFTRRTSTSRIPRAAYSEMFSAPGTPARLESRPGNSANPAPPPLPPRAVVPDVSSSNSVEVGRLIDVDSDNDDDDAAAQFQQKPFAYFDRKPKN